MKNTLETRLGIFFALALLAAVIVLEMAGGGDSFRRGFPVRSQFKNIQELKVGDPVRMAGVDVGRVQKVALAGERVEVAMKLNNGTQVRTDSKATIKFVGLLGQNFVSIDFGTSGAPLITPNALLESTEQADLNTLMVKLENVAAGVEGLTKNFSGENINNLLGPFTDFLKQNSPRIAAILANIQVVSTQIAEGKGTVGRLITDDSLYNSALATVKNLDATTTEIKPLFDQAKLTLNKANLIIDDVNQGKGTVGKLVKDETLYRETTSAMSNIREIVEKINRGQGTVGKLVNDESFLKNAKMTLQKVDKATEGLEDQGPLSVLGIAIGGLF
ncbi:MAG: Mammalian cell entry related domain protein [Verrucomicrobiales bacterium]|jgi:phospholipid/cholesterol/gamma-HCH transport system substrate-binding protein|nr:Mammalian cell entry related domain protein [Verrucomicrobiales bacterium]